MIAVIRIRGQVGLNAKIKETFNRLNIRKKYSCIVDANPSKEKIGMVKKIKDLVAYGEISDETLKKLIEKRGRPMNKNEKIDSAKIIEGIKKGKSYSELNLKPFFRLHPPRKGIDSKKHFGVGKGVLGDNREKINELIERML